MNDTIDRLWLMLGFAMLGVMVISLFSRRRVDDKIHAIAVVVYNPDGSPVTFGQQPLIQTDTSK